MIFPVFCVFLPLFEVSSQRAQNNFAEDYILKTGIREDFQSDLSDQRSRSISNEREYYQAKGYHEDHKSRENKNHKNYYTVDKLDVYLRNDDDDQSKDKILRDYYYFEEPGFRGGDLRVYPDFGKLSFGIKEGSDLNVILNNFDIKFPLENNEISSKKPVTVADLLKFINSVNKHTEGLIKDFIKTKKTLKEMVSLVQALPPEVQKQLNYKTEYQTAKSKFGKVKNTFGKKDLSILYGPKGPLILKPYDDEKGSDIFVPKSLYDSIIASRDSENTFNLQNSIGPIRKRVLPLTKRQKEKLYSTGEAAKDKEKSSRYKTWWPSGTKPNRRALRDQRKERILRRNEQHNNSEYGVKFEMEVTGLSQINV